MEIAMQMSPPIRSVLVHESVRAISSAMNAALRNLMDNVALAQNPPFIIHSTPRRSGKSLHAAPPAIDLMAYDEWSYSPTEWYKAPEEKLADALEAAMRPVPKLTVALANKLMRDAHKRGDALAFNAAREALRSL